MCIRESKYSTPTSSKDLKKSLLQASCKNEMPSFEKQFNSARQRIQKSKLQNHSSPAKECWYYGWQRYVNFTMAINSFGLTKFNYTTF